MFPLGLSYTGKDAGGEKRSQFSLLWVLRYVLSLLWSCGISSGVEDINEEADKRVMALPTITSEVMSLRKPTGHGYGASAVA